jgi:hypothetical protein
LLPTDTRGLKPIYVEVCYWVLLFMSLVILQYLYSLQIKGDSQKKYGDEWIVSWPWSFIAGERKTQYPILEDAGGGGGGGGSVGVV